MICKKLLFSLIIFSQLLLHAQKLPLQLFWQGKTELAIKSANEIVQNQKNYSKYELISSYDFLADYNLEQGHFEANLNYIQMLFKIKQKTSFDSAFYYVRIANYYHCYVNPDSANYFCKKSLKSFNNFNLKGCDSNAIARYYGYLGNAIRNTPLRSISILDSAILYSKDNFIKALNHRRYATFILDGLSGISLRKRNEETMLFEVNYLNCIKHLKIAEKFATTIFKIKKSDLHSRIYDLWSLAERYKGNLQLGNLLNKKARNALTQGGYVFNLFEYNNSLNLEASNKLIQYREKKENINLVYEAEKLLNTAILYWENFLKEELKFSLKNFDDRYSQNPYVKLSIVYEELYLYTRDIKYLYLIQGLIDVTKNDNNISNNDKYSDIEFNKTTIIKLQELSKNKNYAIINYIAATNPNNLMAIVSMPDTTMLIHCSAVNFLKNYTYVYDYNIMDVLQDIKNTNDAKIILLDAYNLCFKNIDIVLKKRNLKTINIITHGLINRLNFEILLSDTLTKNTFTESSILKKYKIIYHTNANILCSQKNNTTTYNNVNILAPEYKKTSYPEIIFGKKFITSISQLFNIKLDNNSRVFFKNNLLIQFIGHLKSNEFSNQQYLIINDNEHINSKDVLKYDLTGSSYLLNGCASNTGKYEMNNKINSLPTYLMNQNAHAVIGTVCLIDDKENAEFLEKFYEFMANGISSSDALYQTKLYFANNNYSPTMWGAYIYYGSDFYLSKKNLLNEYLYAILLILFCGLAVFVVFIKRKLKKKYTN